MLTILKADSSPPTCSRSRRVTSLFLICFVLQAALAAQEHEIAQPELQEPAKKIALPEGSRIFLILRNFIPLRTTKPGDPEMPYPYFPPVPPPARWPF